MAMMDAMAVGNTTPKTKVMPRMNPSTHSARYTGSSRASSNRP